VLSQFLSFGVRQKCKARPPLAAEVTDWPTPALFQHFSTILASVFCCIAPCAIPISVLVLAPKAPCRPLPYQKGLASTSQPHSWSCARLLGYLCLICIFVLRPRAPLSFVLTELIYIKGSGYYTFSVSLRLSLCLVYFLTYLLSLRCDKFRLYN
jgi:hypothetical protein